MGHYAVPIQRDLFPGPEPKTALPSEVMQQLLRRFEQLLAEAAAFERAATEQVDE